MVSLHAFDALPDDLREMAPGIQPSMPIGVDRSKDLESVAGGSSRLGEARLNSPAGQRYG